MRVPVILWTNHVDVERAGFCSFSTFVELLECRKPICDCGSIRKPFHFAQQPLDIRSEPQWTKSMISFVEALNTARFSIEPGPPLPPLLVRQHLARVAHAHSGCRHVVSMLAYTNPLGRNSSLWTSIVVGIRKLDSAK